MDLVSISIARRSNFRGRYAKNYVSLLARVAESSAYRHLRRSIEKSGLKTEFDPSTPIQIVGTGRAET